MKIRKNVKCYKCSNVLDIDIVVKENSKEKAKSEIDVYCPFCDKFIVAEIEGKLANNAETLRGSPKTEKE